MSALHLLYEQDFSLWTIRTADLLKQKRFEELDLEHLIDELGDMGRSNLHELVNRLRVLLAHLLKWQYQYQQLSERWAEFEGKSWRNTIIEQRAALLYLLRQNPGLKRILVDAINDAYPQALEIAIAETDLPITLFPANCPYTQEQILDKSYYPANTRI